MQSSRSKTMKMILMHSKSRTKSSCKRHTKWQKSCTKISKHNQVMINKHHKVTIRTQVATKAQSTPTPSKNNTNPLPITKSAQTQMRALLFLNTHAKPLTPLSPPFLECTTVSTTHILLCSNLEKSCLKDLPSCTRPYQHGRYHRLQSAIMASMVATTANPQRLNKAKVSGSFAKRKRGFVFYEAFFFD